MHRISIKLGLAAASTAAVALLFTAGPGPRAFTRAPRQGAGRALGDADLVALYGDWLNKPYSYMFDGQAQGNLPLGTFLGGIGGIMRYGGLAPAAARHLKIKQRGFYDLSPLEKLAELPIHTRRSTTLKTFSHFNRQLIRWGHENLIPAPGLKIGQQTCQQLYDGIFSRFFRLMAESHVLLHKQKKPTAETRAYLRAMKRRGFDGIDFLQRRYAGELQNYGVEQNGTNFTPPMAVGFWIRRSADRTDGELWVGLQKLMQRYDLKFWTTVQQQTPQQPGLNLGRGRGKLLRPPPRRE